MMRFRYIDLSRLILQTMRPNYALRHDFDPVTQPLRTNTLFRYILAILWPLYSMLRGYYQYRCKWYMFAACTPTYGQIERVMDYWYGSYGAITITPSVATTSYPMWYEEAQPPKYLREEDEPPVFFGEGGNYAEAPIVNIPSSIFNDKEVYNSFIADLNVLVPFYITYTIKVY